MIDFRSDKNLWKDELKCPLTYCIEITTKTLA